MMSEQNPEQNPEQRPEPNPSPSPDQIQQLTTQAAELVKRIDLLVGGTGAQMVALSHTARSNRRLIKVLWGGFILDIVLTLAMAAGFVSLNDVTNRVDETQKLTQTEVLCPLYQQFINSDTDKARALAKANGQDMERRAEAFRVIRKSYEALDCPPQSVGSGR